MFLEVRGGSQQKPLQFNITIDGGATVSFMKTELALALGLPILPNGDLARLADKRHRAQSKGEIDFCVTEVTTSAQLRVRALIMDHLAVDCYGGTTFENDNYVVCNIVTSTVFLHGGKFKVVRPPKQPYIRHPPPSLLAIPPATAPSPKNAPIKPAQSNLASVCPTPQSKVMKKPRSLLPQGEYSIPIDEIKSSAVLVCPPTPSPMDPPELCWPPQVCNVASGSAIYVNQTSHVLCHPKGVHFRFVPLSEADPDHAVSPPPLALSAAALVPGPSLQKLMSKIKINVDLLNPQQLQRLHNIHNKNAKAFDEDMRTGFTDPAFPYEASFSFRQEHKAPPFKIWVPQFNRQCSDLQQAMCDKLEAENVLIDPARHPKVDIRHVSPSFITQKARAKHKPLGECSLDEVRFITCCNVLNDSIHPIAGRSNGYNDILTFLSRWKYLIFADLTSSYFQIKVAPAQLKYMGIMTPHRGIRIMTRLSQGLLNSDVHLDQVLGRVLGDEKAAGFCCVARDDLHIGGDTIDECLDNWETVLSKLNAHNLKVSPSKVRIFLQDSEVFGHRVINGTIRPSDHIVSTLAAAKVGELVTVRQVNSWKGLYKTLIRHLPQLALYMEPFDHACKSLPASSAFDWTRPGLIAAFNAATAHLDQVRATYLPKPDEQLALLPDTSTTNHCAGWALYTQRAGQQQNKPGTIASIDGFDWLPVQYMSGKLAPYMAKWSSCEQEGAGAVMAIDQCRHWINESKHPTWVLPDNKSVVDASNLMRTGRHSTNPRLQSLLASVNRSPVLFRHNSAKNGKHLVPDALSRRTLSTCTSKDCQIERFLADMPQEVQFMSITLSSLFLASSDPTILAAIGPDVSKLIAPGSGPIPLGSRQAWINVQSQCKLCTRFAQCKAQGQIPNSQARDKAGLNRLFKTCDLDRGLIVSKSFDGILMRETSKIFVPPDFLLAVLTVMHVRLDHPLPSQLATVFERYFIAFNVRGTCATISEDCSLCCAIRKFPKQLDNFTPSPSPQHPGTHMNADILKRAGQLILVNTDRFSNFTTATFALSEKKEDLATGLLQVITPMRHHSRVIVRTDRARGLVSLSETPDQQLLDNGIEIELAEHGNRNSNASVDKTIQDLEKELIRLDPTGGKISPGTLALATTHLNNRIRQHGLSASQIHFARDEHTGKNLPLSDSKLREVRETRKETSSRHKPPPPVSVQPGQLVYLKAEGNKHKVRDPLLVTGVEKGRVIANRLAHSTHPGGPPPKFTEQKLRVDPKFLYVPPHRRNPPPQFTAQPPHIFSPPPPRIRLATHPTKPTPEPATTWRPTRPYQPRDDEDDPPLRFIHTEVSPEAPHAEGELEAEEDPHAEVDGLQDNQEEDEDAVEAEGGDLLDEVDLGNADGAAQVQPEEEPGEAGDEGDWAEEGAEEPPLAQIPPQQFEHPPWPPLPRERLLGIGGPPVGRRRKKASPQAVRPPLDIPGRLVSVGEAIKFLLPENQGGERRGGVMSATVLHTAKTVQRRYPQDYNIRTQDHINMSVQLTATPGWWVFRQGRWHAGNHPDTPPPDVYPEDEEVSDEEDPGGGAQEEGGAAGGAQH